MSKAKKAAKAKKEYKYISFKGFVFPCEITKTGKPGKLEKDLNIVMPILAKDPETITHNEKLVLLRVYNVAYHESGKIEEIFSLDSSATNCEFCRNMRRYAERNPGLNIVCGFCYDFEQEKYKVSALGRHTLNMLIMSTIDFSIDELATLPGSGLVRVNSSGDSSGNTYAANMIKYSIAHKNAHIAIWSKNTKTYINACEKYGKPENVILIQSSVFVDKPVKLAKFFDYVFTVYFDPEKVKTALENGACECNGKKCKDCGFKCYYGLWETGANIAELLRK